MVDDNISPNFFYAFGGFMLFMIIFTICAKCLCNNVTKYRRRNDANQQQPVAVYSADGSSNIYYIDGGNIGSGLCHNGGFDSGGGHWGGGGGDGGGDCGGGGCDNNS